jgi:hypothetical protein
LDSSRGLSSTSYIQNTRISQISYNSKVEKIMYELTAEQNDLVDEFIISLNPEWLNNLGTIDSLEELQAISQGGCASGAYMPAVTYHIAREAVFNDDSISEYAIDFLEEIGSTESLANHAKEGISAYCVYLCSVAVESWVNSVEQEVNDFIEGLTNEI